MLEDGIRPCEAALTRLQLDATDTVDRLGRVSDKVDGLTEQCAWTATALHEESTDRGHLATQLTRVAAEVADIEAAGASYRASVDTTIQAVEQNMEVCSSVCELFGTRGGAARQSNGSVLKPPGPWVVCRCGFAGHRAGEG